ncbi:AraC family transcriptional regulator [Aureibacillus halotolerans]|uniref:AraC family transcriptional regulator n=1 Tax=Aureibacillus halotolerans TaxID=1508390 RepID=A0A4R6TZN7_9BACI|nr:AraC family transcriptional regulator [Aureibacillus halotolerans]TDQ37465.1 AraC family transcriptional regulator [Aureibacillus halotolerans]
MSTTIAFSLTSPITFLSCGEFVSDRPFLHDTRVMDSYELIVGISGCLHIRENTNAYKVNPGDCLLLSPGKEHGGTFTSPPGLSFFWLHIRPEPENGEKTLSVPTFCTLPHMDRVHILLRQLLDITSRQHYHPQGGDYLATALFIELSVQMNPQRYKNLASHDRELSVMLEWIRNHVTEPLSTQIVAKRFNYNKDYLSRWFKKRTGVTLTAYIHKIKLEKAKMLLAETNCSVQEIAWNIGIHDEKYFMKLFKTHEKMTPTAYRQAYTNTFLNSK